jgi:insertion element IS1 protein InsB
VLAYAVGRRAEPVFVESQTRLKPGGVEHCDPAGAGGYDRHLPAAAPTGGKANTPQSERKHLTLRPRIQRVARRTLCFAQSLSLHDTVIGLVGNRYEFGTPLSLPPINTSRTRPRLKPPPDILLSQ